MSQADPKLIRCAVYTRKSTDENLELDFNSLDTQRESAEAYIASQKGAGWVCLPNRYDDAGFSGATVERPSFQRLMADVEAGGVDCILVYKIDRLSRSLMDFARIMDVLDRRGVSLVSVTQQFNTTTSMGRLPLNPADIMLYQVELRRLRKAICGALSGLSIGRTPVDGRDRRLHVGNWEPKKAAAFPVHLFFCTDAGALRQEISTT